MESYLESINIIQKWLTEKPLFSNALVTFSPITGYDLAHDTNLKHQYIINGLMNIGGKLSYISSTFPGGIISYIDRTNVNDIKKEIINTVRHIRSYDRITKNEFKGYTIS